VQRLDGAVGLRSTRTDQGVAGAELLERGAEVGGAKLAAVIGEHALQAPAGGGKLGADAAGESRGLLAGWIARGQLTSSTQA
jgi:hypothetical protein